MGANVLSPRWAATTLVAALAGCQALGIDSPGAPRGVSAGVGENLIGEPCRVVSAPDQAAPAGGQAAYNVFCGKWEQPSARIVRVDSSATAEQLATGGAWRERLDAFATCRPPVETATLEGIPAVALDCSLQRGGWPYQALAARIGNSAYLGESIPASLPALEADYSRRP